MTSAAARLLDLLSLLSARPAWPGAELAGRLGVSTRTLRRDVEDLRALGYPVHAGKGPDGGYRLGAGAALPPLLLDEEQAVAVAVALQTAPATVRGLDDALARALTGIRQVVPARLRPRVDAVDLTAVRNAWEFRAPPLDPRTLTAVGRAVRAAHVLRFEHLDAAGRRPQPGSAGFVAPLRVEPHHLVVWAGRWYLLAHVPAEGCWRIFRLDRVHAPADTGTPFTRREPPEPDVARYVTRTWDRDDTVARWQCTGSAVLEQRPEVVARWAPGGSVVERVSPTRTRLRLGAWSWAGIAGLLATFDTEVTDVEPAELRDACRRIAQRYLRAGDDVSAGSPSAAAVPVPRA